jgi:hypothetical protein
METQNGNFPEEGGRSILVFTSAPKGMKKIMLLSAKNDISFSFLMVYITAVIQLLWKRQTCITNGIWTPEQRHHLPLLPM